MLIRFGGGALMLADPVGDVELANRVVAGVLGYRDGSAGIGAVDSYEAVRCHLSPLE